MSNQQPTNQEANLEKTPLSSEYYQCLPNETSQVGTEQLTAWPPNVMYIERQFALANLLQTQGDTRGVRATDLLTGKLIRSVHLPLAVGNARRVGCS